MASPGARPRTAARLAAVQALFQSDQSGDAPESVIDEFVRHRLGPAAERNAYEEGRVPEAEIALFTRIVHAAAAGQPARDSLLTTSLPADWPLGRLDPVLLALLRAALAELAMPDGPPARVVINEYVDVAHEFFGAEEPRLVNAVLDRLGRLLRAAEFPAPAAG
ncbi:MAG: transcription antitermination factor NusB [Acetobacteraceae bacterium]